MLGVGLRRNGLSVVVLSDLVVTSTLTLEEAMKRLLIGIMSLLLVSEVFAGYGGFRGGGFRSFGGYRSYSTPKSYNYGRSYNKSYNNGSKNYRSTPRYTPTSSGGSILPTIILMSILMNNSHSTPAQKAATMKENDILDLQFLRKAKTQEECNKYSQDEKYVTSFRKDKGWCYGFNRRSTAY